jgi:hypothetical protein
MDQDIWGRCTWVLIHSIAVNYPTHPSPLEKENTKNFFLSLGDVLPCRYCRIHYKNNLKVLPIQLDSKMDLVNWTIDLHNMVNELLGKRVLSRQEALKRIISMYKKNPDNPEAYLFIYIGILILFIFVITKKL